MRLLPMIVAPLFAEAQPLAAQARSIRGLLADGPPANQADRMRLFGQFVGDWEFDLENYPDDSTTVRLKGEWHFGWILDGRAVQDVWRVPPQTPRDTALHGYGTTIRFYDPSIAAWRVTWVGVLNGLVLTFVAKPVNNEIVMEQIGSDEFTKWIFSDIGPNSFKWRNESSDDQGKTWRLNQRMIVRRAPTPAKR